MMKLFVLLFGLLISSPSWAVDRTLLVQSRIQNTLSAFLPRTDYLVIVNRVESLDDLSAQTQIIDGNVRPLPGLNLGVDSKGEVVRQDYSQASYTGAVSINIVIENQVKAETYKTIEKLLPEIVGGLRDDDELKVSKGVLRQPPAPDASSPQVSINNNSANENQMQENLKFLALLLLTGGLLFWFISRLVTNNKPQENGPYGGRDNGGSDKNDSKDHQLSAEDFKVLEPEAVGLFLLKELKAKNDKYWNHWLAESPSVHQRAVFRTLPSWLLNYLQELAEAKKTDGSTGGDKPNLSELFNSIALIEQSFKSELQKKKAFLQWFPSEALRYVPKKHQRGLTEASKAVLCSMRPDLGNLVRIDLSTADEMMKEPTDLEIEACARELFLMPSTSIEVSEDTDQGVVQRWASMINRLDEFSPIQSQLEQAEFKLKRDQYQELLTKVAHLKTPIEFSAIHRREWLRSIDPNDFQYWLYLVNQDPGWDLKAELRPMRWAMFQQATNDKVYVAWAEDERKQSGSRILEGFRQILNLSKRGSEREVG